MAKVKVKTHSGAKKRFKITGTGKVKYQKTNKRHRLTQKDTKRKRIARTAGVAELEVKDYGTYQGCNDDSQEKK